MSCRGVLVRASALAALGACNVASLASHDEIYSRGADHFVLCAQSIDDAYHISVDDIGDALDRAQADDTTLHLYAHVPGETIATSAIEAVLAAVVERDMRFATYSELETGEVPGSLALSFDDHSVAAWYALRPLLDRHRARVTFFVSAFATLAADEVTELEQLAADGHDIEFHSTGHFDAVSYSTMFGMDEYLAVEIVPALDAMRAAGYAPTVFAYPFGARNAATDAALAPTFAHLRAGSGPRRRSPARS
jgi:hypothetical protein